MDRSTDVHKSPALARPILRAIPNLISLARLVLVPVVLLAIWRHEYEWALMWCAVAGLSDGLDGFLARRLHAISRAGTYLDPAADKLLLSGTYLALGLDGVIPWWVTGVVFGRDLLMLLFLVYAILFTDLRDFQPTVWGKISTALQISAALLVLLGRATRWVDIPHVFEGPMLLLTVLATVWSAIHYSWVGIRMLHADRASRTSPTLH